MYYTNLSAEDTRKVENVRGIINSYILNKDTEKKNGYINTRRYCQYYSYSLFLALNSNKGCYSDILLLANNDDPILRDAIHNFVNEDSFNSILKELSSYDSKDLLFALKAIVNSDADSYQDEKTPESITDLAVKLLDIKADDQVADIGSGNGSFIMDAANMIPDAHFTGFEISIEKIVISLMRKHINKIHNVDFIRKDIFELNNEAKYNKVFANYPFNMKLRFSGLGNTFLESCKWDGNWAFNEAIRRMICWGPHNKAVALMPLGSTFNSSEKNARKTFVGMGVIDAIIALPPKLFDYCGVSVVLIVFAMKRDTIKFIDASSIFSAGRKSNYLSDNDISRIIQAYESDSEISKTCSLDDVEKEDYCLTPSRYLSASAKPLENGVPFGSIIDNVTRGAQIPSAELDKLVSRTETNYQYLMLSNIQDGLINNDLPYLSSLDKSLAKYCLNNNDLILSKNGVPYKVAIAHPEEGKKILANGNMFVITINQNKANPLFIKAFLESEVGIEGLKRISMGSVIPNLSLSELKQMLIPLPPLEEQNIFAEKYQEQMNKIEILKIKLNRAIAELGGLFDVRD